MGSTVVSKLGLILDAFLAGGPSLSFGSLGRATGLPPGTLRRLLVGMIETGLLRQDPQTRNYELGPKILRLSHSVLNNLDYRKIAQPLMQRLVDEVQEAAYLAIRVDEYVLYVEVCQVRGRTMGLTAEVGTMYPLYGTGTGKVLLAHAPASVREQVLAGPLRRFTERTIDDPDRLAAELREIRRRGYAVNRQEFTDDVVSVAAPIFDRHGTNIAALAVSGPAYRLPDDRMAQLASRVQAVAAEISQQLGFDGTSATRDESHGTEGDMEP